MEVIRHIAGTLALATMAFPAMAQGEPELASGFFAGASPRPRFGTSVSVGPDARALRYEYRGRWLASAGGEMVLVGLESKAGVFGLTLGGLLEVSSESTEVPVPYQFLRAVVGVRLRAATHLKQLGEHRRFRFFGFAGLTHESDHAAGLSSVKADLSWRILDQDNFSSFEYVRLRGGAELFSQSWSTSVALGTKVFVGPINSAAGRKNQFGLEGEVRVAYSLSRSASTYLASYAEVITHDLGEQWIEVSRPYRLGRAELGLSFSERTRLDVYVGLVGGSGRGIDFIRNYPIAPVIGLRGTL